MKTLTKLGVLAMASTFSVMAAAAETAPASTATAAPLTHQSAPVSSGKTAEAKTTATKKVAAEKQATAKKVSTAYTTPVTLQGRITKHHSGDLYSMKTDQGKVVSVHIPGKVLAKHKLAVNDEVMIHGKQSKAKTVMASKLDFAPKKAKAS
ncbi:NirD/YgiW/YdeI family stress tolerance protein [Pokkaliibacter sp. CJK22405]|uniref:NirD/YgiW/YdeI family stress tolerance protein n=1 Tax=Pokkaliibacter sp. CJK22405 TaxID=3384615 RepID=UPI003984F4FE